MSCSCKRFDAASPYDETVSMVTESNAHRCGCQCVRVDALWVQQRTVLPHLCCQRLERPLCRGGRRLHIGLPVIRSHEKEQIRICAVTRLCP